MVCASVVEADRRIIREIEPFALEKGPPLRPSPPYLPFSFHSSSYVVVVTTPSYQSQLGPSIDWQSAWNHALPNIKSEQQDKAHHALKVLDSLSSVLFSYFAFTRAPL